MLTMLPSSCLIHCGPNTFIVLVTTSGWGLSVSDKSIAPQTVFTASDPQKYQSRSSYRIQWQFLLPFLLSTFLSFLHFSSNFCRDARMQKRLASTGSAGWTVFGKHQIFCAQTTAAASAQHNKRSKPPDLMRRHTSSVKRCSYCHERGHLQALICSRRAAEDIWRAAAEELCFLPTWQLGWWQSHTLTAARPLTDV